MFCAKCGNDVGDGAAGVCSRCGARLPAGQPAQQAPGQAAPGQMPPGQTAPGYSAPPGGGQYGAPPQGGQYGAPAQGEPYGTPPGGQQYGAAPQGEQYGAPAQGEQYGAAPQGQQYGAPPQGQPYGPTAGGQQYGPPAGQPYGGPPQGQTAPGQQPPPQPAPGWSPGPGSGGGTPAFAFDVKRWTPVDITVGVASLVALIALFLPWFDASVSGFTGASGVGGSESGMDAHGWLWIVFIVVLAILAYLVMKAGFGELPFTLPAQQELILLAATGLNLLLVLIGFLLKPTAPSLQGFGNVTVSIGWDVGSFLALVAVVVAVAALIPAARNLGSAASRQ